MIALCRDCQRCPNCELTNPPDAIQCDCAYNSVTSEFPLTAIRAKEPTPKPNPATSERVIYPEPSTLPYAAIGKMA